jgi:hypothetical protein
MLVPTVPIGQQEEALVGMVQQIAGTHGGRVWVPNHVQRYEPVACGHPADLAQRA